LTVLVAAAGEIPFLRDCDFAFKTGRTPIT
jgi:hypothetical protein